MRMAKVTTKTMKSTEPLRFIMLGAGFWARYQLAAWGEQGGAVQCVGVCDSDRDKAEALAQVFGVDDVYTDAGEALEKTRPDFVDIVTPPATHAALARLCVERNIAAICQKPLAESVREAQVMVETAERATVPLLVHENWRWQAPLREAKQQLEAGTIGRPFRARLTFSCSFPVFEKQPFLATLPQFILTDIGTHILDTARALFGEAQSVYATTRGINPVIKGEDVATVMLRMGDNGETTVIVEMSYASRTEHERFPQTYLFVEGDNGALEIGPDYLLRVTTRNEGDWNAPVTTVRRVPPPRYDWANPVYDLVQASMVPCQADLLKHLRGEGVAQTTARDNLETLRLVFAAYESAAVGEVVRL